MYKTIYTHFPASSILNIVIADNGDENKRKGKMSGNGNEKNIGLEMKWKWERFHENGKNNSHSRTINIQTRGLPVSVHLQRKATVTEVNMKMTRCMKLQRKATVTEVNIKTTRCITNVPISKASAALLAS